MTAPEPEATAAATTEDDRAFHVAVLQLMHARATLLRRFWIASGIFCAGAVSALAASGSGGGVIWTGGMLVGALMWWRVGRGYLALRKFAPKLFGAPALAFAGCVLLGSLGFGALAGAKLMEAESAQPRGPAGVGSCWRNASGEQLEYVSCSVEHQYEASAEVSDSTQCPTDAAGYVNSQTAGKFLCMKTVTRTP